MSLAKGKVSHLVRGAIISLGCVRLSLAQMANERFPFGKCPKLKLSNVYTLGDLHSLPNAPSREDHFDRGESRLSLVASAVSNSIGRAALPSSDEKSANAHESFKSKENPFLAMRPKRVGPSWFIGHAEMVPNGDTIMATRTLINNTIAARSLLHCFPFFPY